MEGWLDFGDLVAAVHGGLDQLQGIVLTGLLEDGAPLFYDIVDLLGG